MNTGKILLRVYNVIIKTITRRLNMVVKNWNKQRCLVILILYCLSFWLSFLLRLLEPDYPKLVFSSQTTRSTQFLWLNKFIRFNVWFFIKRDFIFWKLDAKYCNFTKSIIAPWMFFTFFKLYKWYQITQSFSHDKCLKPKAMNMR